MKLYADLTGVRTRQIVADLLAVAWTLLWITIAVRVHDLVERLAVPGQHLEGAGNGLAEHLSGAGDRVDGVPAVGGALASPLRRAAEAARDVAGAGQQQQDVVGDLALTLAVLIAVVPIGLVLLGWVPLRLRWAWRAAAATRLRGEPAGRDLLALRALTTQPLRKLYDLDPRVAARWREGDEAAVAQLAALQLRSLGLHTAEPVTAGSATAEPVTAGPVTAEPATAEPATGEPVAGLPTPPLRPQGDAGRR